MLLGTALGGAVLGTGLGLLGHTLQTAGVPGVALVIAALGLGLLHLVAGIGLKQRLPQRSWLVPDAWLTWRNRPTAAFAAGFVLGTGFLTSLITPAFYAFVALVLALPQVWQALLAGSVYGLTRGAGLAVEMHFELRRTRSGAGLGIADGSQRHVAAVTVLVSAYLLVFSTTHPEAWV
jgi:hypothetical protein